MKRTWAGRKRKYLRHMQSTEHHASRQSQPRQKHQTLFSAANISHKGLSPERHSLPRTRTHSGQEARSFTSCSTRPRARRFLFLRLRSSQDSQSRPPAPASWNVFGKPALPDPASGEESLSNLIARGARSRRNGPPLLVPHTGFLRVRPAAPRSSSSRTPAGRPGRRQRAGPYPRPRVYTPSEGRLPLSPNSPLRTYSSLAAATRRSQGNLLPEQPLFCFRCEIAASKAARPRPRPKSFADVVISGSGVVGGRPGEGRDTLA